MVIHTLIASRHPRQSVLFSAVPPSCRPQHSPLPKSHRIISFAAPPLLTCLESHRSKIGGGGGAAVFLHVGREHRSWILLCLLVHRLTTSAGRDSMRRSPNGNSGQSRSEFQAAFSRVVHSHHRRRRRVANRASGFLRPRTLAGGGGSAGESQRHYGAQRRDAIARHRGGETLPRRVRAGNLAYPFHGTRQ